MSTETNVRTAITNVIRSALQDVTGEVLAVGFDEVRLGGLLDVMEAMESVPTVRVLTTQSVLSNLRRSFVPASRAAELIEAGELVLRTSEKPLENGLLLTDEQALAVIPAGETAAGLGSANRESLAALSEHWGSVFEDSEPFDLRTPGRSRVRETLTETFGEDVAAEFSRLVGDTEDTDEEAGEFGAIDAALLAAARHEELFYDISKWGEDVGVASKASFSRKKRALEERGLIETEDVPIDIGRPRLRLLRGDRALAS